MITVLETKDIVARGEGERGALFNSHGQARGQRIGDTPVGCGAIPVAAEALVSWNREGEDVVGIAASAGLNVVSSTRQSAAGAGANGQCKTKVVGAITLISILETKYRVARGEGKGGTDLHSHGKARVEVDWDTPARCGAIPIAANVLI